MNLDFLLRLTNYVNM